MAQPADHRTSESAAPRRAWLGALAAVLVVGGAMASWQILQARGTPSVSPGRIAEQHAMGPADAPVTIVEYGDFDCTTCLAFYRSGIIDRILEAYPGKVRFVFRNMPIITAASPALAEAAECAADQGAFWRFYNTLYQRAPTQPSQMKGVAGQLGLDTRAFDTCYDSRRYAGLVKAETQEAYSHGFQATPAFLVNGTALGGPPSYAELSELVQEKIANP